jgi:hypothetical protein
MADFQEIVGNKLLLLRQSAPKNKIMQAATENMTTPN